jgi:hypothetical protein
MLHHRFRHLSTQIIPDLTTLLGAVGEGREWCRDIKDRGVERLNNWWLRYYSVIYIVSAGIKGHKRLSGSELRAT